MLKWTLAFCVSFVVLSNHYARDTIGALEKQMEHDLVRDLGYREQISLKNGKSLMKIQRVAKVIASHSLYQTCIPGTTNKNTHHITTM